jgi:undecaprenyl-diphosphatase
LIHALESWDMAGFRLIHLGLHRDWLDPFFALLSFSGLGWPPAAMVAVLLIFRATRRYALPVGLATALGGVLFSDGLKALIPRDRPSLLPFAIPQDDIHYHSFPSGHTATSFGLAIMVLFLTWRLSGYRWIGLVAISWSSLVAFSRIYRGVHWPTDVVAGICCGVLGACFAYAILDHFNLIPGDQEVVLESKTDPA